MSLHSAAAACARTTCACAAILALALAAFLALPESLLYNDYVSGAIFGTTILIVSGVVQFTHGDDGEGATAPER